MIDEVSIIPFNVKCPVLMAHLVELLNLAAKENEPSLVKTCTNALIAVMSMQDCAEHRYAAKGESLLKDIHDLEDK